MIQLILPGFESYFSIDNSDELISNPQRVITHFEKLGYQFLSDWNSGSLLTKNNSEPYIPERVLLPSGKIIDEKELAQGLDTLVLGSKERAELEGAFYYWNACFHEDVNADYQRHNGPSFLNDLDEKTATEKYRKHPFFRKIKAE